MQPLEYLVVNGTDIQVFRAKDPKEIPCGACGASYACEFIGVFIEKEKICVTMLCLCNL